MINLRMRRASVICVILLMSCAKEDDPFQKIYFINPHPANNAVDVTIRDVRIYYEKVQSKSLTHNDIVIRSIYCDTVNPPIREIYTSSSEYHYPNLNPGTIYYWSYLVENVAGETESDVLTFTTAGFDGHWKLGTVLNEFLQSPELTDNEIFPEIIISGNAAKIRKTGTVDTSLIDATFEYDASEAMLYFVEYQNGIEHSYQLVRDCGSNITSEDNS